MANQSTAATTIVIDDSPAATRPASAMLVNGSEKQFAAYVEQHVNQFSHNTNWQNFMSVVSLYNLRPAAVLTISPADRARFNEAAAQVNIQLAKQKNADANRWLKQADHTTRMINFLWNVNQEDNQPIEIQ